MSDRLNDSNESVDEKEKKVIKDEVIDPYVPLNTKPVPIIITLLGTAISMVLTVIQFQDFGIFFIRLIISVVAFSIIGSIIKLVLDLIFNKKPATDNRSDEKNEIKDSLDITEDEEDSEEDTQSESVREEYNEDTDESYNEDESE